MTDNQRDRITSTLAKVTTTANFVKLYRTDAYYGSQVLAMHKKKCSVWQIKSTGHI